MGIEALTEEQTRRFLQELDLGSEFSCLDSMEIATLFDMMDIDSSDRLCPQEFVDGMIQMRGTARARRIFELHCDMIKKNKAVFLMLETVQEQMGKLHDAWAENAGAERDAMAML